MRFLQNVIAWLATGIMVSLGLICALAAAATQGGRFSPRLDVAAHFAPFWLGGGLIVLLFAALSPRNPARPVLFVLGAVATLGAGLPVAGELLRPMTAKARADAPHQLKLIQFNTFIDNARIEDTAAWIAEQDADIVVMEEAIPAMRDALLARHPYYATCGDCSVIIFSRARPVANDLPRTASDDPRAPMTRATFKAAGGDFTVVGLHYVWPTDGGLQQAQGRRAALVLDQFPKARLIVAGDFNSTPWSWTRQIEDARFGLERRTQALFTWPARPITRHDIPTPFPFLAIDHVYAGADWKTVSVARGQGVGSDHYPVVATLALTGG